MPVADQEIEKLSKALVEAAHVVVGHLDKHVMLLRNT